MPPSRLPFAITDLIVAIGRLSPRHEDDGSPPPDVVIYLDPDSYAGVKAQIVDYEGGREPLADPTISAENFRFIGVTFGCGTPRLSQERVNGADSANPHS